MAARKTPKRARRKRRKTAGRSRLYVRRDKDGTERYYGDLRALGGRQVALKVEGERHATSDPLVAEKLLADEVTKLLDKRVSRERVAVGIERRAGSGIKAFAAKHLIAKKNARRVSHDWIKRHEKKLELAVEFFGAKRELDTIVVRDVERWLNWLQERPGRRGNKGLSGGSLRHYLNSLSNLYRRAQADGVVPPGYNPAAAMMEKPTARREEARWLEVHEAALLLESARTYEPTNPYEPRDGEPAKSDPTLPFMYPLIATFLLTGGRVSEVLGLEVNDVNFGRATVTFRPNDHRGLKTKTSHRSVPLWPQLAEILRAHLRDAAIAGGLLFPSPTTGMMTVDIRKPLDAIAERAGWQSGEIRGKAFRHTYCAARLQSLDNGKPVSPYTVARELGHGGMSLVNRVYGHLGQLRHRSEVVEYPPEIIDEIGDLKVRRQFVERLRKVRVS